MTSKKIMRDNIYSQPLERVNGFRFDQNVARVFPDMIRRSVPGYEEILQGISLFTAYHVKPHTRCYDLGSSLGAASLAMQRGIKKPGVEIYAIDNSPDMIRESKNYIKNHPEEAPIHLICADFRDIKIENASVVVLNYTLQFLDPAEREERLRIIYQGMLPNSVLIVSEKILFPDAQEHEFQYAMHLAFKKAQGYSNLEISQKRTSLENVLIAETFETHKTRLLKIGFKQCFQWFQYFNFISMAAIK